MTWNETCKRQIPAPTRRGFGRTLLERVFASEVGGAVKLDFQTDGLKCRLEIPDTRVTPRSAAAQAPPAPRSARESDLEGLRVLVVEDAALVAEDLAGWLRSAGASVIGPFFTLHEAKAAAGGEIDLALLDIDVDGEPIWNLASDLRARGTPFVLTTGFSPDTERPPEFANSLVVNKPYQTGHLHAALRRPAGREL